MKLKIINQAKNLSGKRVVVRVDFNVPIQRGKVVDNSRIIAALPTIRFLERQKARQIVLITHLGRPQGKVAKSLSLKPVAKELSKLLKQKVNIFSLSQITSSRFKNESIVLLENIRFLPQEERNDPKLAKELSQLGDLFVNEAFSVSHHLGASFVAITKFLPSFAGLALAAEVGALTKLKTKNTKPYLVIIGGAKAQDKLPIIQKLMKRADQVIVGGVVANTFFKAKGLVIGKSLFNQDLITRARAILQAGKKKIILPKDVVVDVVNTKKKENFLVKVDQIQANHNILDLGTETIRQYAQYVKKAKIILWSGTLGLAEQKTYSHGTLSLARLVSARARGKTFVIVGGGDTINFFHQHKLWVDYLSLAGGAMLDYLVGKKLPGLEPLLI